MSGHQFAIIDPHDYSAVTYASGVPVGRGVSMTVPLSVSGDSNLDVVYSGRDTSQTQPITVRASAPGRHHVVETAAPTTLIP